MIKANFPVSIERWSRFLYTALPVFVLLLFFSRPICSQTLAFGEAHPQFGPVALNQKSDPKIISIVNISGSPIFLTHISVTEDFTVAEECPIWLPEGDGCRVFVTFTPSKLGRVSGDMFVGWSGTRARQSLPLVGLGEAANTSSASPLPKEARTTNDEERANRLIQERMSQSTAESTKRYIYSSFLSKDPAVIAEDERIFSLTKDTEWKERIAALLIKLLDTNQITYSDYIRKQATKSLVHAQAIPLVYSYDQNRLPKGTNPAVVEWCQRNKIDIGNAYDITYFEISKPWSALAAAEDPRNYDLLVDGLHSANILIPEIAAGGLALLQDARAIPELISAGHRVPADGLGGIVEALLCFPDSNAQAAAWDIIPDSEKAKEKAWFDGVRGQIEQHGPHAFFGWG